MDTVDSFKISDEGLSRIERVRAKYRLMHDDPGGCEPLFIINSPAGPLPGYDARLADPMTMLDCELKEIQPHLDIEDDSLPTVRVDFGTAQIASAFGCELFTPPNSRPAAKTHVLHDLEDVDSLATPPVDAGIGAKMLEWTRIWKQVLPEGVAIQHPDVQSPLNSAHLIRGNDIFTDFYDDPERVGTLLHKISEFMVAYIRNIKSIIGESMDWHHDWGGFWKGACRISNCSNQMISPEMYRDFVMPHDIDFMKQVGGGRMHYCGVTRPVIDEFLKVPLISALDVSFEHHDLWDIAKNAPEHMSLFIRNTPERVLDRLLAGDWPSKRNLVFCVWAGSVNDGRELLKALRSSFNKAH